MKCIPTSFYFSKYFSRILFPFLFLISGQRARSARAARARAVCGCVSVCVVPLCVQFRNRQTYLWFFCVPIPFERILKVRNKTNPLRSGIKRAQNVKKFLKTPVCRRRIVERPNPQIRLRNRDFRETGGTQHTDPPKSPGFRGVAHETGGTQAQGAFAKGERETFAPNQNVCRILSRNR